MADKEDSKEYNPEKDKEIKKGPLKPKHKNQYGESTDKNERNLSKRVKGEND